MPLPKNSSRSVAASGAAGLRPAPSDLFSWPTAAMCVAVFAVTLLAYFPALHAGFIWDDPGHITRPDLRSLAGLLRIWFEPRATQQYYPFLHSAFWIEHRLWGDAPLGYHAINILFHATSACLIAAILRRLAIPGAWFAALLFALHPVCVESVAWVSEQKNTLSTVLYLCAALAYLRFDEERRPARYALATVLFVLALLSKTVTATLPAALLVVFWWKRGKISWSRDALPLLPWFALGALAGWYTSYVETNVIGAATTDPSLDAAQHVLLAGRVIWFYLGKLLWPAELIFFYPRWEIDAGAVWQYAFPLGVVVLAAALFAWRKKSRGPLAALLFFAGSLFPALGFVNVFPFVYSWVADHFQYLASIGVFAAIAAGLTLATARVSPLARGTIACVLLATLGVLTWRQSGTYRDIVTFYNTIIARNPECWMAWNNLGTELTASGRVSEAVTYVERALQLRPDYAEAENNLGDDLNRLGRPREAVAHLERALQFQPRYAEAHNNLGAALMKLGRSAEGIEHFRQAVAIRPEFTLAHRNLGQALASVRNFEEAIAQFTTAVRLDPESPDAQVDLAYALTLAGRFRDAAPHFEEALRLKPDFAAAHSLYGRALVAAGRLDEAIDHFQRALLFAPNDAETRQNLAAALRRAGRAP